MSPPSLNYSWIAPPCEVLISPSVAFPATTCTVESADVRFTLDDRIARIVCRCASVRDVPVRGGLGHSGWGFSSPTASLMRQRTADTAAVSLSPHRDVLQTANAEQHHKRLSEEDIVR